MIGRTLDRYRIESQLGEGGMGVVYRARDTHLDRIVAVKVLGREKILDPSRRQRFTHEARAASALNHPGIVTIHDIRSEGGTDFIVMEYVEGSTLEQLISAAGLRPEVVLRYGIQIADALARAHEAGILHRDLKPSNIIVTPEGRTKILDFGLAKLLEAPEPSSNATTVAATLTEQGVLLGTAAYMSPEQAEGRKLDARSDIFSLGSVLYEMVTGRRPFTGESKLSILSRIASEDPQPPTRLTTALSPELEKIILRCLRKDPARRYQTMRDLKAALEDLEEESRSSEHVRQVPARRRWAWLALPLVLLIGVFSALRVWRGGELPEPLTALPLTTFAGEELYPSLSPDGNHVAFTWNGTSRDNRDVYVQLIGSAGSPLRLTSDPANDYNPVWSPDGQWIAFLRLRPDSGTSELRLIPPLGGPERHLTDIRVREAFVTAPYLTWCPDSRCLVTTDSPGAGRPVALFAVSRETGEKRQLTSPQPPASGDANPAVSPDGRWLVFRRNGSALFNGELYRVPLEEGLSRAGAAERLTPAALDAGHPAWLPNGREILFSARGSLWRLRAGGERPAESPPARLPFAGEDGLMPVVSRAGTPTRLVYVRSFEDLNIWRIETPSVGAPAPAPPTLSISSTRADDMPQVSPDGRRVAFTSDRTGGWEIWLSDLDGGNAVRLTSMGARVAGYPHWSPDGHRIVFHSNPEGSPDVFVVSAAGGRPRNLTGHAATDAFPSFSRDGTWVYFTSNRSGEDRIWKIPASGGDPIQVTQTIGYTPRESLDGAWLYFVQSVFTPGPLLRLPVSGGPPVKVVDGVVLGNFAVLDGGIYYIDRPSGEAGIYSVDRPHGDARLRFLNNATGTSVTVAANLGDVDLPLAVAPDGRTILFGRVDSAVVDLMLVENFR